jgi:hypothetical protein
MLLFGGIKKQGAYGSERVVDGRDHEGVADPDGASCGEGYVA